MKIRSMLERYVPYAWEPSNEQIAKEFGINPRKVMRFDTNTSPFLPTALLKRLEKFLTSLPVNRYPDTSYSNLRRKLATYNKCSPDCIIVSNGADEALDIIGKVFIEDGGETILSVPTYSYYSALIPLLGGKVRAVKRRKDFSDDFDAIKSAIDTNTASIILCSPNNPTGNLVKEEGLRKLLDGNDSVVVVVDEAYYEFGGKTLAGLTSSYDNLIIVRTFSKAFSLAGLRVGYTIASEKTTALLNRVRPPNSVGVISLKLAEIALSHIKLMRKTVAQMLKEKDGCASELSKIDGIKVFPTDANFMIVRFPNRGGSEIYRKLARKGVVVRDMSGYPSLRDCIRFSVGTRQENSKLLDAIREIARSD